MKGWGWQGKRRGPSRAPMTKAEIEDAKTKKHHESEASRLIREAEKAKRRRASQEVDALIEAGHKMSAPRNTDLYEEHKRNREVAQQVDDLVSRGASVSLAVNQDGHGGAFVRPTHHKHAGLVRQFVADIGRLFSRPVDTNKIDRVIAARAPTKK
jgi:hypothetical protein